MEELKVTSKNPYKIATIILSIAVVLFGTTTACLVFDKLKDSNAPVSEANIEATAASVVGPSEILGQIRSEISKIKLRPELQWQLEEEQYTKDEVDNGLYYDISNVGVAFFIPGTYLRLQIDGLDDLLDKIKDDDKRVAVEYQEEVLNLVESYLTEAGFSKAGEYQDPVAEEDKFTQYIDKSGETVCSIEKAYLGYTLLYDSIGSIACANINSISESEKNLATELVEIISKDTEELPTIIHVSETKIVDSEYKPYQRLENVRIDWGSTEFYRKSPESSWVEFSSLRPYGGPCSIYDSDAARAHAGKSCIKENGKTGVVIPKS